MKRACLARLAGTTDCLQLLLSLARWVDRIILDRHSLERDVVIDLYLSHVLNFSIVPSSFCCLQSYVERGTRGSSHLAEGCNILLSKGDLRYTSSWRQYYLICSLMISFLLAGKSRSIYLSMHRLPRQSFLFSSLLSTYSSKTLLSILLALYLSNSR